MAHEITRLRGKLFNTPMLVEQKTFDSVLDYIDRRNAGVEPIQAATGDYSGVGTLHYAESKLGVIHIDGPLTNKSTGWEAMCGGTSYESIKEDFETLVAEGAKTIAFASSSGGGEAYGMLDTGNYLRRLADENDVQIVTYVDGLAASACYGLIAISDEIVSNANSEIGSIGVLIRLLNDSKALEMNGYERTYITAGKSKIPFEADGAFRQDFLDDLQYKVDTLYEDFTSYVAQHRNIPIEAVKGTEAKTFLAKDALELGLIDKVMTVEEFYDYLAVVSESNMKGDNILFGKNKLFNKSSAASAQALTTTTTTNEVTEDMEVKELQAQLTAVQTELVASQEAFTALTQAHEMFAEKAAEEKASLEAAVSEAKELVASLEADKVQTKLEGRKASLAKFVPAATAEQLSATFASLDDAAFEVVLGSYSLKHVQESNSELLEELGEQGEPDESQPTALVDKIKQSTRQHIIK